MPKPFFCGQLYKFTQDAIIIHLFKTFIYAFVGLWVIPNAYTLRHARGYGRSALRNWQFQVSKDGVTWTTLYDHQDDQSLNDPGSTGKFY